MLKAAFNALLKTLEEPLAHVKFIFATTEADRVPITVRSRRQRFDLRRISAEQLATYFRGLTDKEGVTISDDALHLIAQAADGSARDGLSLLDQAIALGEAIEVEAVRDMLGLSDYGGSLSCSRPSPTVRPTRCCPCLRRFTMTAPTRPRLCGLSLNCPRVPACTSPGAKFG